MIMSCASRFSSQRSFSKLFARSAMSGFIRRNIVIVQDEFREFPKCGHYGKARKRRARRVIEADQNGELRVVRGSKANVGVDHVFGVTAAFEVGNERRAGLPRPGAAGNAGEDRKS